LNIPVVKQSGENKASIFNVKQIVMRYNRYKQVVWISGRDFSEGDSSVKSVFCCFSREIQNSVE
tara:strand:+ start:2017 stop:2208 length:192 start_codon:yes stop_codon:yes gene_type:complete